MKKFKWHFKILSLVIVISALLAVIPMPQAEEYSVPTLYIDNRAWHMSSLFPLAEQNGVYLVPISFLDAIDGVEISFDEVRACILIQHGESYVSVNVKTQNALLSTGEVKQTTVAYINDEYYVVPELCASALGFEVEIATFYEKDVLRLKTEEALLDLQALVERNQISDSTPPNKTDATQATPNRQEKTLSFVADFTKMTEDEQSGFISLMTEKALCTTVIIEKKNLTDSELRRNLISANALGCSFMIRAKNSVEVSECNTLLRTLLQRVTRLVTGPDSLKVPLESIGYIFCGKIATKVSTTPRFEGLTAVEIVNLNAQIRSDIEKWVTAAKENKAFITPLNQKTGN